AKAFEDAAKAFEDAAKAFEGAAKAFEETAKAFEGAAKAFEETAKAFEGAAKAFEDAAKAFTSHAKAFAWPAKGSRGAAGGLHAVRRRRAPLVDRGAWAPEHGAVSETKSPAERERERAARSGPSQAMANVVAREAGPPG